MGVIPRKRVPATALRSMSAAIQDFVRKLDPRQCGVNEFPKVARPCDNSMLMSRKNVFTLASRRNANRRSVRAPAIPHPAKAEGGKITLKEQPAGCPIDGGTRQRDLPDLAGRERSLPAQRSGDGGCASNLKLHPGHSSVRALENQ